MDLITVALLVGFSFITGLFVSYAFTVRHFTRETTRLVEEAWRLRG